ncbi:hypothetical protein QN277_007454 [Acacia crassicarpa]|uniref:Phytocyanin domain-containing protein n=1 Tax=Acacia crassicarpa TaxID=499986 RepID=A0AAE1IUK3_9FABA|nr:hypothetical protein QN277_007454 [Acacia crassicarpa]
MSFVQRNVVLLVTMMMMMCEGAVYKVGDSAGWTTLGKVDYKNWASSKNIIVGDTIIFEYNPQYHNVMRVTNETYKSCNVSEGTPLETFNSGNDSIKINSYGHHYFICGIPGHCQEGLKIDVNVIRVSATKTPTPSMDDKCPNCSNKASPFMASFGLIGLAMSFLALAA